ncbi:MAG: AAA family ATPase [Bacteroidota bacterium]|nr:AAA family ATPase [Bacteroidota bacterium]MDE2646786.1 AAA family ATPase [Bacteroidota bacterium]
MKQITLENYRCFYRKQIAPLAPLTLLVGDNSTGKTSFLAMIRALWDCFYDYSNSGFPNFKEAPFDLGSFDEIAHHQSERSGPASTFEAGFCIGQNDMAEFVFAKSGTIPIPVSVRRSEEDAWVHIFYDHQGNHRVHVGTCRGTWEIPINADTQGRLTSLLSSRRLLPLIIPGIIYRDHIEHHENLIPIDGSPLFSEKDAHSIAGTEFTVLDFSGERPFLSAPIRSRPRRTYDPATSILDPEGDYVPMLMANLAMDHNQMWKELKQKLEKFGRSAGIFDEIHVKQLGRSGSDPFQVQIRKFGKKRKGPKQNLIDVGYGISQVLPILTELLLPGNSKMALLQQPEIHLHPSAQAALGGLFCEVASQGRQLIVETHSQFMIDRIRMDVRDGKTDLKPENVSILFFERTDTSVQIHPIRIDELGNVLDTPNSYGRFFMEETSRSLGF